MGSFWPRIYVVKKGHARDIYFLLETRNFGYFSAPSSLFTCCYLLSTRQCLSSAVLALSHHASIRSFCQSKGFALV
jgi:hypothetical protein